MSHEYINNFTIEEVRAFWDKVAPIYEPTNAKVGYIHKQRYERALEFADVRSGHKVLNIWSRTGHLIPYLRTVPGLELYNREASSEMMAIAKKNFPSESFASTDLENLSEFPSDSFDRIVSLETLEHTPKPSAFIRELARILKPGGRLIMSMPPKGHELEYKVYTTFFEDHGEGPHVFPWPSQVKEMLADAGLKIILHKRYVMFPMGNERLERLGEQFSTALFGWNFIGNFGVRHFFVATK